MKIKDNNLKESLEHVQGDAYSEALDFMKKEDNYAEKEVDDYIITVVNENAEGTYNVAGNELKWITPDKNLNAHVEVIVRDRDDHRFIPGLKVFCKIISEDQKEVGEKEMVFFWHPFLFHYANNWEVPGEGNYFAEIRIPRPEFPRHDEIKGKKYCNDVNVRLGPLKFDTGRKPHGPE